MTIFAVLMPVPQPPLAAQIEKEYPGSYFKLSDTQYLISARGTAVEVSGTLGLDSTEHFLGNAVVFSVSSYWGRAPTTVWDWIRARLESP